VEVGGGKLIAVLNSIRGRRDLNTWLLGQVVSTSYHDNPCVTRRISTCSRGLCCQEFRVFWKPVRDLADCYHEYLYPLLCTQTLAIALESRKSACYVHVQLTPGMCITASTSHKPQTPATLNPTLCRAELFILVAPRGSPAEQPSPLMRSWRWTLFVQYSTYHCTAFKIDCHEEEEPVLSIWGSPPDLPPGSTSSSIPSSSLPVTRQ
jgi:hypothetical protein